MNQPTINNLNHMAQMEYHRTMLLDPNINLLNKTITPKIEVAGNLKNIRISSVETNKCHINRINNFQHKTMGGKKRQSP
jgi:hypothetical protein